jgi:predicted nucleic acid-binding protein
MRILADTDIFIASMRYADLKRKLIWKLLEGDHVVVVTDFMLEELRENFTELYHPHEAQIALDLLLRFLGTGQFAVKTYDDYSAFLAEAQTLIAAKDAPILAATMLPDVDYLVARDKRDFLNNLKLRATPWIQKIKSPQELLGILG